MRWHGLVFIASLFFVGSPAWASPITYSVMVNTSSTTGTVGSLDFNFNPGPLLTQSASLQLLSFTSGGSLAGNCPCGIGDVSGQLPTTLMFDNGTGFNDYFDNFTFGSTISFQVSLYGPALSSPDGLSSSGTTFAFSMFSDAAGTIPVLTSDTTYVFAFIVNVNLDGTTSVTNFSSETEVGAPNSGVPELGSLTLVGAALALLGTVGQRRYLGLGRRQ